MICSFSSNQETIVDIDDCVTGARSVAEAHGGQLTLGPVDNGPGLSAHLWWPQ